MRSHSKMTACTPGATLTEAALAIGVLAVVIPLVSAALGEAGRTIDDARLDSRSPTMVASCIEAIERARDGEPGCLPPYPASTSFAADGEICALAFTGEGSLLGRISMDEYEMGIRHLHRGEARYLAKLSAKPTSDTSTSVRPLALTITLEHPASAPEALRTRSSFHSFLR